MRLRSKRKHDIPIVAVVCSGVFFVLLLVHLVAYIQFDRLYKGRLKRAADANTLQLAEKELAVAVDYLRARDYHTEEGRSAGSIYDHTSILYSTPDEQISFHYDNVFASLTEVRAVIAKGEEATPLERSNVLMKLRETLLDNSGSGQSVTCPSGLHVYPHNMLLAGLLCLSLITGVGAFVFCGDR